MPGHSSSSTFHDFIILSYYTIKKSKKQKKKKTKVHNKKNLEVMYTGLPEILRFSDSQISKIHIFQGCSHIVSCIFLKYFDDNWKGYGSRFWQNFGSSRNHPKSIGIDQESIFSHFGIIKTPFWH